MNISTKINDGISAQDAFDAAEVFMACMFADNQVLSDCGLEEEDFEWGIHQIVYKEAQSLFRARQSINPVSIKPHLPRVFTSKKGEVGTDMSPAQYLAKLASLGADQFVREKLSGSIEIIKAHSLSCAMRKEAEFAIKLADEGHTLMTLDEEIGNIESRLRESRTRLSELKSGTAPGNDYLTVFSESAKHDGIVGVPFALPEIKHILSEPVFEAGNLYGLLSSSGEGKTSLTMQLIYHAVLQGHPVLFLSYDQSAAQCIRQMIAQVHEIGTNQQREPMVKMTEKEREQCISFANWINNQPFEIIRCQRQEISQLVSYTRRFIKRRWNGKTPFIVLDHIGKVKARDPRLSADKISGEVTVEFKALMDEMQSAGLMLNQRNSLGTARDNPRPIARDLYGGEGARADYDAIMYLYRAEKYKSERLAIASGEKDFAKISKVFGSEVEGKAELGAIKVRFGDPNIQEIIDFEARYTRYRSQVKDTEELGF